MDRRPGAARLPVDARLRPGRPALRVRLAPPRRESDALAAPGAHPQMSAMDLARLRPNVGIVLFSREGLVWLGRRAHTSGPFNWQFPQGGIDAGEEPLEAALRELREETGVATVRLLSRTPGWLSYVFPPEHQGSKIGKGWLGQKQIWFAFAFEGEESEIDLGGNKDVEFDAWRWAELDEAVDLVIGFKREVYRHVAADFRPLVDALRTVRAP